MQIIKFSFIFLSLFLVKNCFSNLVERQWKNYTTDAEFIKNTLLENHSGGVNREDPDFIRILNCSHDCFLKEISKIDSIDQYTGLLSNYVYNFCDKHLAFISPYLKKNSKSINAINKQFVIKEIAPETIWINLSTFWPNQEQEKELEKVIADIPTHRNKKYLIFDCRLNTGGNSMWGTKILEALFTKSYVNEKLTAMNKNVLIDWRLSIDNIKHVASLAKTLEKQFGIESFEYKYIKNIELKMREAFKTGQKFYTEKPNQEIETVNLANCVNAKIIIIIDQYCASACLDFIDDIKAMNHSVRLIGQTTSADTVYMEVRNVELPSKIGILVFPIKVYRNRFRKNNEPYYPDVFIDPNASEEEFQNIVINLCQ